MKCPQGWHVKKNWTVELNHAVDNEGQSSAHRQESLELPGSNTAHSLKTAKLLGGMGLNSWGSPASGVQVVTLPKDLAQF